MQGTMKILEIYGYRPGAEWMRSPDAEAFIKGEFTHAICDGSFVECHVLGDQVEFGEFICEVYVSRPNEDGEAVCESRVPDLDDDGIIDGYKDYRRLIQRERKLVTLLDKIMSMEMKVHPIWDEVRVILSESPVDHAAGTVSKF